MPPPDLPDVSDAELALLKALWARGPSTVRALHDDQPGRARSTRKRAYNTVQTLLGRLEEKGYVTVDRSGHAHVFTAAVTRERLLDARLEDLADKVCDGLTSPLVMRLVERSSLGPEDIARFRALLGDPAPEDEA